MSDKAQGGDEEELQIGGVVPKPRASTQDEDHVDAPKIAVRTGSIRGVEAGMSNEELVSLILHANDDELIPWELVELPSGGSFYQDPNGNPWPDGFVRVRPMGQTAEKVLANQRLAETGQSMDYLFRECCEFPGGFDPVDLLVGDRMFLLYYLRGITHGNIYEFLATCPNQECKQQSPYKYDLNQLASTIRRPSGIGSEPFKVVLPYMSRVTGRDFWVRLRFIRASDQNNMIARRKVKQRADGQARPGQQRQSLAQRKAQQAREQVALDNTITESLELVITDVMGVDNPFTIKSLIQKLHAQDTATIREWLRDNTPGIDSTVTLTCPNCGQDFTVELPITETFFRPSRSE